MSFTGLVDRMKGRVNAAKFATKLAVAGGLASLVGASNADAQTLFNMNVTVRDSNGNVVQNGGNLQQGQTYFANIDIGALSTATLGVNDNFSSILSTLKLSFGNGATSSDATFGYTSTPTPAGTPTSNDLFANVTTNSTYSPYDTNQGTFTVSRTLVSGTAPKLTAGSSANIASLYFTPTTSTGTLSFNFLTGTNQFDIKDSRNLAYTYNTTNPNITFFGQNNPSLGSVQFNFSPTAVPEPSTYALIAGGIALIGAAALRRRRKVMQAGGKMYEASGQYVDGKDVITVKQIGSIENDRQ